MIGYTQIRPLSDCMACVSGSIPSLIICKKGVIGQNVLVKTAVVIVISMATAVISFLKEDTGWTKRVGKIA